jgi:hypothetical protein
MAIPQFAIFVMPGPVPGIHALIHFDASKAWMAGTRVYPWAIRPRSALAPTRVRTCISYGRGRSAINLLESLFANPVLTSHPHNDPIGNATNARWSSTGPPALDLGVRVQ